MRWIIPNICACFILGCLKEKNTLYRIYRKLKNPIVIIYGVLKNYDEQQQPFRPKKQYPSFSTTLLFTHTTHIILIFYILINIIKRENILIYFCKSVRLLFNRCMHQMKIPTWILDWRVCNHSKSGHFSGGNIQTGFQ